MDIRARDIHVDGIVQGVGLRPFVARLARARGLRGWVKNAPDGVDIHVEAPAVQNGKAGGADGTTAANAGADAEGALDAFAEALRAQAPAAARIVSSDMREAAPEGCEGFEIRASKRGGTRTTLVSPDIATCDACLAELFDPDDRRYHYPFINCTNCGPRFTIIDELPYDRPSTSMHEFEMCPECAAEYADEADRRYHAQPDACFSCGPALWFAEGTGGPATRGDGGAADNGGASAGGTRRGAKALRKKSDACIRAAADALLAGEVVAVKGLGGWHLACDARDEEAVSALRVRKHRPSKPLAVMVKDLAAARELCHIGEKETHLLRSPARPIVLLHKREGARLAAGVALALPEIGVMLPSTPVQHLLLDALGDGAVLVMTSGNRSGEPIVADDGEALGALSGIAGAFLGNNRAIVARYDDSVVRVQRGNGASETSEENGTCGVGVENGAVGKTRVQLVRRARGYAPLPLSVRPACGEAGAGATAKAGDAAENAAPPFTIFAAGSEQKATFAYLATSHGDGRAWVSQHLGDLEHVGAWRAWEEAKGRYEALFDLHADALACDLHPEYLASKWARAQARETGLPLVEVQHHHAHIAAVMGENALGGRVLGVALDGTGYGPDGTIWGCELLDASREDFRRLWHLPAFSLPGGTAAVLKPERAAFGLLSARSTDPVADDDPAAWMNRAFSMENPQWQPFLDALCGRGLYAQMVERRLNCPSTSSLGRLFDASAVLLDAADGGRIGYDGEPACLLEAAAARELEETGVSLPAPREIARQAASCLARLAAGKPLTAFAVHLLVAQTIIEACGKAREDTGLTRVALGGGCMVNRIVHTLLVGGLEQHGFTVYENIELAPNDACLSYGQAVVAQARLVEGGAGAGAG